MKKLNFTILFWKLDLNKRKVINTIFIVLICICSLSTSAQVNPRLKLIDFDDIGIEILNKYYRDADGDYFGNPSISSFYSSPPIGWVLNNFDCNDSNANITRGTLWFRDDDADGFGDPSSSMVSCSQPLGYVNNALDGCPLQSGPNNGCPNTTNTNFGNYNYIYEEVFQVPETETNYTTTADENKIKSITYFDGLGRKSQTRGIKQSPLEKDIVSHYAYDVLGRQTKEFMPFTSSNNNGVFETGAESKTIAYYNTSKYENTTNPFSENQFDNSPLNRVLKQAAPGSSWRMGGGHETIMEYLTNVSSEVKYFKVSLSSDYTPTLTGGSWYGAGELYKTITKNENWKSSDSLNNTIEEFKDKKGNVVLKRTYNNSKKHDTYYVFDMYGNATFVLSPKVDAHISNLSTINSKLNDLCYINKYDERNRLVEKKDPGKGWVHIIYDKLDRPILTQDSVQRAKSTKEWLFTKYDKFGRVTFTGLYKNNGFRVGIQSSASNHAVQFESKGSTLYNYTNTAFPTTINSGDVYTVSYYDDYNFDKDGLSIPSNIYGVATTTNVKALATGSKVKVLGISANNWITTIIGYNDKEQAIYTASKNEFLGTTDVSRTKLDFAGKVIENTTTHTSDTTISLVDKFTYDHVGRLLTQKQKVNTQPEELITKNTYDELGVLENKKTGKSESDYLQSVDYKYNIRGWLKQINDPNSLGDDLFGFKINYNTTDISGSTALFNGNISETIWKTANDVLSEHSSFNRGYSYKYDALNQISQGNYKIRNTSGNYVASNYAEYNLENIEYDKNGNITKLKRYGNHTYYSIDDLTYTYDNGNKLLKIIDNGYSTYKNEGFKDNGGTLNDYSYDGNGNTKNDYNKEIRSIDYNQLNLPTNVNHFALGNIRYIYDATGTKIQKIVNDRGTVTTTSYAGNFTYKNNSLQFFNHPEGYVNYNGGNFKYVYQFKDHIGNVRLSYSDKNNDGTVLASTDPTTNELIEESNYYPFGLKHKGYNEVIDLSAGNEIAQKINYNGKEYEKTWGYNMYEMDMRSYDPATARWVVQDPVTHHEYSPYNAFDNNPVYYADPSGADSDASGTGLGRTRTGLGRLGYSGGYTIHFTAQSAKEEAQESAKSNSTDCCWDYFSKKLSELLSVSSSSKATITNESVFDFFLGISSNFKQGQTDAINDGINFFARGDYKSGDYWGSAAYNFGSDYVNGNSLLNPSGEYMFGLANNMSNMSVNDWAYAGGYSSPGLALGAAGGYAFSAVRFGFAGFRNLGNIRLPVYRRFGGGISGATGEYWSMINPRVYGSTYRNFSGLPDWNTGAFQVRGNVRLNDVFNYGKVNPAGPYHGNFGRLVPELKINPSKVKLTHYNGFKIN